MPNSLTRVHIADHFDLASGQQPENIALEPSGAVDLTMSAARQVVRVYPDGTEQVLATLPAPADGGVHTPVLGFPLVTGLVRAPDGTLYFLIVQPDGSHTVALTGQDGLSGPSAVAVRGRTVYITSASYILKQDPNLLVAHLSR